MMNINLKEKEKNLKCQLKWFLNSVPNSIYIYYLRRIFRWAQSSYTMAKAILKKMLPFHVYSIISIWSLASRSDQLELFAVLFQLEWSLAARTKRFRFLRFPKDGTKEVACLSNKIEKIIGISLISDKLYFKSRWIQWSTWNCRIRSRRVENGSCFKSTRGPINWKISF